MGTERRKARLAQIHVFSLILVVVTILVACATERQYVTSSSEPQAEPSAHVKTTAERWVERNNDRP
jgi:hypothetical protein